MNNYDVIIIGAGAGGMTAAIYAKRAGKSVLVLEKMMPGGQMLSIDKIANFPSFSMTNGYDLSIKMKEQVASLGVEMKNEEVLSCDIKKDTKLVKTHNNEYQCKSIIIATGARPKALNIDNEKEFYGRGLSYCATCDGKFFENKVVGVVGSYETSKTDVEYLTNLASKIIYISSSNQKHYENNPKVEEITNSTIKEICGENKLEIIKVANLKNNIETEIKLDALFVVLGKSPDVSIFNQEIKLDKNGFIIVDEKMQTNIDGVFAVGDVRSGVLKQIITSCSDGAIAGTFA